MNSQGEPSQPKAVLIDPQPIRSFFRRKHTKNAQSQLIPRKTELKIIKLNQQVIASGTPNIINFQFAQQNPIHLKKNNKKASKKTVISEDKRSMANHKQYYRNRYQELVRDNIEYFKQQTMQIGPCAKSIVVDTQLNDIYTRRKMINAQKLTYPYRSCRRQCNTKATQYRTLMHRTSRTFTRDQQTFLEVSNSHRPQKTRQGISRPVKKINTTQNIIPSPFYGQPELKQEYKKEISTLIPIRKPSNKKDYFVFGLSQKNNSAENKIQLYRDLLWKVNYSNGLYVCSPDVLSQNYKFFVGEGNNSNLIRSIMRRRWWWSQATSKNQQGINFLWTQLKFNSFFTIQDKGLVAQYFVIERIKSEHPKTENRYKYEQDPNQKLFGRFDYKIWKKHLQKNQKTQKKISQNTYQRRIKMYQKKKITKIDDSKTMKMHNHLQSNFYIGNKKALFYNIKRYLQLKGQQPFQIIPLTFHIKKGVEDSQYINFLKYYEQIEEERVEKRYLRNMWIVKPGQNTNRGNGISVCHSLDDIKLRLKGRQRNSDGKLRTFIIQKYIQNPLLYQKRKFDIRHFVLLTCINGSFKAYWFQEGYIRTSSAQFNLRSGKDPLIHLTNDAIQKNTPEYGKYQKGNKLSYVDLQKYLDANFQGKKFDFFDRALPIMKQYAIEAVKSTYFLLDSNRRRNNFQLLGLDFMLDEQFKPWLIEVNTNPCLEMCCPLLHKIIPNVIENTCKICLDPLFPPPQNWPNNKKLFFGQDPVAENKFEIIFDESSDGTQVEKIFAGKDKLDSTIGKVEEDNQTFENDGEIEWENDI